MPCTTILVGKNASIDGSTMIARNDDNANGKFAIKKLVKTEPNMQLRKYKSVISKVEIDLPNNPLPYTSFPTVGGNEGLWCAQGINSKNVGMSATETITTNPRVLGADPLVVYKKEEDKEIIGGIGEEDLVYITLPYINTAREGVKRLGSLLEKYGTYENNGIAFNDENEVWYLETIGGHHFIARRLPDDMVVALPNQLGLDYFDLKDALGEQKDFICSADLKEFILNNHLANSISDIINPRLIFGSKSDSDHVYNTPRAWFMDRYLCPSIKHGGENAVYTPESNNIPWCVKPEFKVSIEDVKYLLSSHYQGTMYDPYSNVGSKADKKYRTIGINRTSLLSLCQIRPYAINDKKGLLWFTFASNPFNAFSLYISSGNNVDNYFGGTKEIVDTANFYWANRIISALADPHFNLTSIHIERYNEKLEGEIYNIVNKLDRNELTVDEANNLIAKITKEETDKLLSNVLYTSSMEMKNSFKRSDN